MNPLEALKIVLNMAALAPVPKAVHIQVDQAGLTLRNYLVEAMKPVKQVADEPEKKE